jgi:hypothetical protein
MISTATRSLPILAVLALALLLAACSGTDDANPVAPAGPTEPQYEMDDVTVVFNTLTAYLDCDGPDNPGDFFYSMNIDTIDQDGDWHPYTHFGERSANLSNGVTRVSPFGATLRMPRYRYARFRVRMTLREDDGASDDFSEGVAYQHRYDEDNQGWAGHWDKSNRQGHEGWEMLRRNRETNWLGKVTEEGCHVKMTYTVTARKVE